ncbi:hypothetical protein KCU85_g223, partial [Aureobasidium melanogenum]
MGTIYATLMIGWKVPRTFVVFEDFVLCSSTHIFISPPVLGLVPCAAFPVIIAPPLSARRSVVARDGDGADRHLNMDIEQLARILLLFMSCWITAGVTPVQALVRRDTFVHDVVGCMHRCSIAKLDKLHIAIGVGSLEGESTGIIQADSVLSHLLLGEKLTKNLAFVLKMLIAHNALCGLSGPFPHQRQHQSEGHRCCWAVWIRALLRKLDPLRSRDISIHADTGQEVFEDFCNNWHRNASPGKASGGKLVVAVPPSRKRWFWQNHGHPMLLGWSKENIRRMQSHIPKIEIRKWRLKKPPFNRNAVTERPKPSRHVPPLTQDSLTKLGQSVNL